MSGGASSEVLGSLSLPAVTAAILATPYFVLQHCACLSNPSKLCLSTTLRHESLTVHSKPLIALPSGTVQKAVSSLGSRLWLGLATGQGMLLDLKHWKTEKKIL